MAGGDNSTLTLAVNAQQIIAQLTALERQARGTSGGIGNMEAAFSSLNQTIGGLRVPTFNDFITDTNEAINVASNLQSEIALARDMSAKGVPTATRKEAFGGDANRLKAAGFTAAGARNPKYYGDKKTDDIPLQAELTDKSAGLDERLGALRKLSFATKELEDQEKKMLAFRQQGAKADIKQVLTDAKLRMATGEKLSRQQIEYMSRAKLQHNAKKEMTHEMMGFLKLEAQWQNKRNKDTTAAAKKIEQGDKERDIKRKARVKARWQMELAEAKHRLSIGAKLTYLQKTMMDKSSADFHKRKQMTAEQSGFRKLQVDQWIKDDKRMEKSANDKVKNTERSMISEHEFGKRIRTAQIQGYEANIAWDKKLAAQKAASIKKSEVDSKREASNVEKLESKRIQDIKRRIRAGENLEQHQIDEIKLIQKLQKEEKKLTNEQRKLASSLNLAGNKVEMFGNKVKLTNTTVASMRKTISHARNAFLVYSFALRPLIDGIQMVTRATVEYERATEGINSVGAKFGYQSNQITGALDSLTRDGLLKVTDASKGLRNLLATGIGLPKALAVMNALKDSAAFNRQGMLEYGEAVVGATDGIKNMISRMVDNAGITKNLSNILKEQARVIGKDNVNALSDYEQHLLIADGIIRESALFSGDADRLGATMSGQLDAMAFSVDRLLRGLGGVAEKFGVISGFASTMKGIADSFTSMLAIFESPAVREALAARSIGGVGEKAQTELDAKAKQSKIGDNLKTFGRGNSSLKKSTKILNESSNNSLLFGLQASASGLNPFSENDSNLIDGSDYDRAFQLRDTLGSNSGAADYGEKLSMVSDSIERLFELSGSVQDPKAKAALQGKSAGKGIERLDKFLETNVGVIKNLAEQTATGTLPKGHVGLSMEKAEKMIKAMTYQVELMKKPLQSIKELTSVAKNEIVGIAKAEDTKAIAAEKWLASFVKRAKMDASGNGQADRFLNAIHKQDEEFALRLEEIAKKDSSGEVNHGQALTAFNAAFVAHKNDIAQINSNGVKYYQNIITKTQGRLTNVNEFDEDRRALNAKVEAWKADLSKIPPQFKAQLGAGFSLNDTDSMLNTWLKTQLAEVDQQEIFHNADIAVEKIMLGFRAAMKSKVADKETLDLQTQFTANGGAKGIDPEMKQNLDNVLAIRIKHANAASKALASADFEDENKRTKLQDEINAARANGQKEYYTKLVALQDEYLLEKAKYDPTKILQTALDETATSFGSLASAAAFAGNKTSKQLDLMAKKAQLTANAMSNVVTGITALGSGNPIGIAQGAIQIGTGILQGVEALSGPGKKSKAESNRNRTGDLGTTISRGPQTININPTIIVEAEGDVLFSQDSIEIFRNRLIDEVQQAVEFNELTIEGNF